jgi:hypothetical protein
MPVARDWYAESIEALALLIQNHIGGGYASKIESKRLRPRSPEEC